MLSNLERAQLTAGMTRDLAERVANAENQLAAAVDVAKLKRNESIRNAKTQYEADLAVAEAEHRTAISQCWLDRHYDPDSGLAELERM